MDMIWVSACGTPGEAVGPGPRESTRRPAELACTAPAGGGARGTPASRDAGYRARSVASLASSTGK